MRETTALQMERLARPAIPPLSAPQSSTERANERREIEDYLRTGDLTEELTGMSRAERARRKLDAARKERALRKLNAVRLAQLDAARRTLHASAVRETRRQLAGKTLHSRRR